MTARKSIKINIRTPRIVGVIASGADLARALRLRSLPDLFELRLDALGCESNEFPASIARLRAPLIITARHPREGGLNNLNAARRRDLLLEFLPYAACVDVELRSVSTSQRVLTAAREMQVCVIISVHDFRATPSVPRLKQLADTAKAFAPAVLKIATRTDSDPQLARLLEFFRTNKTLMPTSAMGMGKLGRASRLMLAREGSVLNYAHLGVDHVGGQLSVAEMRRHLGRD